MTSRTPAQEIEWKKALLGAASTIENAIACLDASGLQIAIVASEAGELLGTITDGDIRRGLLRGLALSSPVSAIYQANPVSVSPQTSRAAVLKLMANSKLHQIPVLDEKRKVVDLHIWDELLAIPRRGNLMVVLAGGKGTRLLPHTENCPKPMLTVRGKPILEHIIERASDEGFSRFVFAINYLGNQIESYFGDGKPWGVEISYIREVAPLGTAGALGLLNSRPSEPVVVTNGDIITTLSYAELLNFHVENEAEATMAVRTYEWQNPFGVVQTDGLAITGFSEKPVWRSQINAGIYVLAPHSLDLLAKNEHCDMPTLFNRLREKSKKTIVFPMNDSWLDIGHPDDLEMARQESENTSKE